MDLRRERFLVKMYVKMKELSPVVGERVPENFVCRSAYESLSADFSGPENPIKPMISAYCYFQQ